MFKFLFGVVVTMVILYLLWGIVRRLLLGFFRAQIGHTPDQQRAGRPDSTSTRQSSQRSGKGPKWDAETVDYEEIPEK